MSGEAAVAGAGALAPDAAASRDAVQGSGIGFAGVTVAYKGTVALDALTLDVAPGEIMAIIGPSGCGKTTALRAVAGFVRPAAGRVHIGGQDVTDLPPHARGLGMVVQSYALFPHMRVEENVAFGLRARRLPKAEIRARVAEALRLVGMAEYGRRLPRELSGGQQQRVAIARALAIRPRVLLLDEPLSALDAQIRRTMIEELARLHRELPGLTVLYVTHDQGEALTLADRIAIMRAGRLVAQGPADRLYREPPNRFAAEFLGRANLLPVEIESAGLDRAVVRLGATRLTARLPHGVPRGGRGLLCVRPHALSFRREDRENSLRAVVHAVTWHGEQHTLTLEAECGAALRVSCAPLRDPPSPGSQVDMHFFVEDGTVIAEDPVG